MPSSDTYFKPGNAFGRGRPKGSKNIYSKGSVQKLEQLGFDPIEAMVEQYNRLYDDVAEMKARKESKVAIAQLEATLQKIALDLMRYGYARTPEPVQIENSDDQTDGLKIKLT